MQSPMDEKPLSARLLTTEMLVLYAGLIFSFATGSTVLANKTEINKDAIAEIKKSQAEMKVHQAEVVKDISSIKGAVGIIKANQQSMDQNINQRMTRQDHRIDKIIDLLEHRRTNGH